MDISGMGRALMMIGLVILALGILLQLVGKVPGLGRLPGDIVIKRDGFVFYFPLATSILISIVLSLIFYLLRR